jgi:hypothetical protein
MSLTILIIIGALIGLIVFLVLLFPLLKDSDDDKSPG